MKHIQLFILIFSTQVFAQLQITNDSVSVNGNKYKFTLMSYGKHSKAKPMKAFTCDINEIEKVKDNIQKCYQKYKIEYTDFYIMPIDKNLKDDETTILDLYLKRIDEIRMSNNLSTIRFPFKEYYDNSIKDLKIIYDTSTQIKLTKVKNLHQNIKAENICYLISGRK